MLVGRLVARGVDRVIGAAVVDWQKLATTIQQQFFFLAALTQRNAKGVGLIELVNQVMVSVSLDFLLILATLALVVLATLLFLLLC